MSLFIMDIDHDARLQVRARMMTFATRSLLRRALLAAAALWCAAAPARAQRPRELVGKPEKMARQNAVADRHDLTRMSDPAVVRRMAKQGHLVRIPTRGTGYFVDSKLGTGYRHREVLHYARPWVRRFLQREGAHFAKAFKGSSFKVSSLVRTEDYQKQLVRKNVNAAPGRDWRTQSAHLTGAALDVSKRGMSPHQINWMRRHLVSLQRQGWVIAVEEMKTNTFHIFVQPKFGRTTSATASRQ
jgi:hypothetical protein